MNVNPRIAAASLAGLLMVGGSYWLAQNKSSQESQNNEPTVTTKQSVREFIPVADTDADGLPDWQQSLNIPTVNLSTEEEDITSTGTFTADLLGRVHTGGMDSSQVLSDIGTELTRGAVDQEYTRQDIYISDDNSPLALRAYGNAVAAVALKNAPPPDTEDELTVLNRALVRNQAEVLEDLQPTIDSYEKMVVEMLNVSVPSSMVREHLAMTNVYQAMLGNLRAFQGVFDDALPAMIRFRRYQADAEALYVALNLLYLKLDAEGIEWNEQDIASKFITIERP